MYVIALVPNEIYINIISFYLFLNGFMFALLSPQMEMQNISNIVKESRIFLN